MAKYYIKMLTEDPFRYQEGMEEHLETLYSYLSHRKTRRRDIEIRIRNETVKEMGLEVPVDVESDQDAEPDAWKNIDEDIYWTLGIEREDESIESDKELFSAEEFASIQNWIAKASHSF
jgi:hypothetical protein